MQSKKILLSWVFLIAVSYAHGQISKDSDEIEQERVRWNKSLTKDTTYQFNKNPNQLLIDAIKGRKSGKALDLGMGQGRNTIYLAQQGWDVTGVDIADEAVAFAQKRAAQVSVKIKTELIPMEKFQYGTNQWNLVVHVYEGCLEEKELVAKILKSLKPGGLFVFEFFHRDAGLEMGRPNFGCITNSIKEAIEKTSGFNIISYQEEIGVADYSLKKFKLVKLVAVKKSINDSN
jgi:SAM-dependent methyltransferase